MSPQDDKAKIRKFDLVLPDPKVKKLEAVQLSEVAVADGAVPLALGGD